MRPLSRTLVAVGVAALTATLAATLVASPASAKPAITLTPGDLPRGADVSSPHLEGKTVVDGAVRVKVKAPMLRLLGKSGAAYVVGTANAQGGHGRIYRVAADGTRTLLAKAHPFQTLLSGDGATIVTTQAGPEAQRHDLGLRRRDRATRLAIADVQGLLRRARRPDRPGPGRQRGKTRHLDDEHRLGRRGGA